MQEPRTATDEPGARQPAFESSECVQSCLEAVRRCQQARAYVSAQGGRLADPLLLSLLLDCAEACELAARWMQRDSAFHADLCAVAATICKSCEEACGKQAGDATLQSCGEACRRCFDTCLRIGQHEPVLHH